MPFQVRIPVSYAKKNQKQNKTKQKQNKTKQYKAISSSIFSSLWRFLIEGVFQNGRQNVLK